MARFKKKPVVIEAVQFDGLEYGDYANFAPKERVAFALAREDRSTPVLYIQTSEGTMRADVGDWIIKGIKGEFYPCKPDIFAASYESVMDDNT